MALAVVLTAFGVVRANVWVHVLLVFVFSIAIAEVLPTERVDTAGLLRLVGFLYMLVYGLGAVLVPVVA